MHKKPWSLQPGGFLCKKNSSTPPVMKWASATWQRRLVGHAFSILFLFLLRSTAAQTFNSTPPPPPNFNPYALKPQFNPGMAAIVIALISAFFVMAFFSIYIRNRRDRLENQRLPTVGAARPHGGGAARGLDPAVVESFPKFVYSEVKKHKIGKGALECAVCLSEFEDDDNLRLLPKCDHVFHPDCIDSWFAAHTTCPVCRTNFSPETGAAAVAAEPPPEVAITVNDGGETPEAEEELPPLPPGRQRRRIPRSHSTGHSVQLSEDRERYTLRLPEMIRRDVVAGRFKRSASCYAAGEGSAAKGRSVGEMIGGGRSSFKMRTWDRWASFKRSFSVKMPRGEDAGTSAAAAAAVGRSLSKTKEGPKAEDGSVNAPIPVGADR